MAASLNDLFPESSRVVYENAPLVQVICQLRFPPLLSIERSPVDFQEQIRGLFPLFERGERELATQLPQLPPDIAQAIGVLSGTGRGNYEFLTEDRASKVTLTPEFLALTTTGYKTWELFREQLRLPLQALISIYKPSFFQRIGLRYQDTINRERLGLQDRPWSKLLNSKVLGELALPPFEESVLDATRIIRITLPDGKGSVQIRHGLTEAQGRKGIAYTIDLDAYVEPKTEVAHAESTLNHFNDVAGRAFRWFITDELRDALRPKQLEGNPGG